MSQIEKLLSIKRSLEDSINYADTHDTIYADKKLYKALKKRLKAINKAIKVFKKTEVNCYD